MKVRKHAFVAGSTLLAGGETRLILRVNHCNQNSLVGKDTTLAPAPTSQPWLCNPSTVI